MDDTVIKETLVALVHMTINNHVLDLLIAEWEVRQLIV